MENLTPEELRKTCRRMRLELERILGELHGDNRDNLLRSQMHAVGSEAARYAQTCWPIHERVSKAISVMEGCFGPRNMKKQDRVQHALQTISVIDREIVNLNKRD